MQGQQMADDNMTEDLQVSEAEPEAEPVDRSVPPTAEVANPALKDYFNIDSPSDKDAEKFSDILHYFKGADSVGDLMYKLRQLENRLGEPLVGETRLNRVHRFVKITNTIESAEAERDSLLR